MTESRDRVAAMLQSWGRAVQNREMFFRNNRDSVVRFGELASVDKLDSGTGWPSVTTQGGPR